MSECSSLNTPNAPIPSPMPLQNTSNGANSRMFYPPMFFPPFMPPNSEIVSAQGSLVSNTLALTNAVKELSSTVESRLNRQEQDIKSMYSISVENKLQQAELAVQLQTFRILLTQLLENKENKRRKPSKRKTLNNNLGANKKTKKNEDNLDVLADTAALLVESLSSDITTPSPISSATSSISSPDLSKSKSSEVLDVGTDGTDGDSVTPVSRRTRSSSRGSKRRTTKKPRLLRHVLFPNKHYLPLKLEFSDDKSTVKQTSHTYMLVAKERCSNQPSIKEIETIAKEKSFSLLPKTRYWFYGIQDGYPVSVIAFDGKKTNAVENYKFESNMHLWCENQDLFKEQKDTLFCRDMDEYLFKFPAQNLRIRRDSYSKDKLMKDLRRDMDFIRSFGQPKN